jgi:hypothetical protein
MMQVYIAAVEFKFGIYDYRNAVADLLTLKQKCTVEEYNKEFDSIRFHVSTHNRGYDELLFTSHFVNGLKDELKAAVHYRKQINVSWQKTEEHMYQIHPYIYDISVDRGHSSRQIYHIPNNHELTIHKKYVK